MSLVWKKSFRAECYGSVGAVDILRQDCANAFAACIAMHMERQTKVWMGEHGRGGEQRFDALKRLLARV